MSRLTLATISTLLLFTSVGFSAKQKPTTNQETIEQQGETRPTTSSRSQIARNQALFKNMGIHGFYNMSDSGSFEASANGQNISGTMKTTSSYGVGADLLVKNLDNGLNIKALGGYEFPRTFNSMSWRAGEQSGTQTMESPKPELSMWIVGLQGELVVSEGINIFGGGNFNFPTVKNSPGSYSGKFGWHAGASLEVSDNLYVDAMWRSINLTASQDKVTFDNINFSGMMFRGRMTFE